MRKHELLVWISATALGLGLGFVAILQTGMLIEFGFDWKMHWDWIEEPVSRDARPYVATLMSFLVGGAVLGLAQALVVRSRNVAETGWLVATVTGFGVLAVIVEWPLIALDLLGIIPGPVEPIIATVGGATMAGIFQYLMLRRQGFSASKWLILWVVGLVASLVPMVILFVALDELNISISWPTEVFVNGFIVGGFAALVSGRALFATLPGRPAGFVHE
jgi:hypothetical protein